jgi:hypothetical protein
VGVHLLPRHFQDSVAENGAIDLVSLHYNGLLAMGAIKNKRRVYFFVSRLYFEINNEL